MLAIRSIRSRKLGFPLLLLCSLVVIFSSGCALRVGPKVVPHDRFDYSSAISTSWKEQMLMNLVRRRYADPPFFLDVQQVVASYSFGGDAGINAPDWKGNPAGPAGGVSGHWTESPTITYSPLAGEMFIKSMLRPLSPAHLFFLVQSGWPIDIVFVIAIRSINGLHAGSTMEMIKRPPDPAFYQALKLLRELQQSDSVAMRVIEKGEAADLVFTPRHATEELAAKSIMVRKILGLSQTASVFHLALGAVPTDDKEIAVLTRSMLEILAEASAGVDVPDADVQEGRATKQTLSKEEAAVESKFLVRVHSSDKKPPADDAFASIRYHNHWFWIDDRDLPSKRGLGFMLGLFLLAESGPVVPPPSLTISRP